MVEIIPKPAQRLPLWQNILFYFSISLLLASVLSYFVLDRFQKESVSSLAGLRETREKEKTPEEKNLEARVFSYQRKIQDFSGLVGEHRSVLAIFDVLENLAHPRAQFTSLRFEAKEAQAVVSGNAETFQALDQQFRIFREDKNIVKTELSSIGIGGSEGVEFSFTLLLAPQLLNFR